MSAGLSWKAKKTSAARGLRPTGITIAVLPLDGVEGLLGMNLLRHFRFEIDQDKALSFGHLQAADGPDSHCRSYASVDRGQSPNNIVALV